MKKQLSADDLSMILQWVVVLVITPFVLLPLFPRQEVSFLIKLAIVLGGWVGSGIMTLLYIRARSASHEAAVHIVNITAALDIVIIIAALLIWPRYLPDLFWIFPILVIVIANRFGYKESIISAAVLAVLYGVTIVSRFGVAGVPARTVIADTALRMLLLMVIALATAFISQREKREGRDARILSSLAASMGSTLEVDELMDLVVGGMSQAAGLGRCSAYMVSEDGRWALPQSTTEKDPALRDIFFMKRIDLKARNVAMRAMETKETLIVDDPSAEPLLDENWIKDFGVTALMVLPFIVRDEARGVVFIERREGMKKYFLDREVDICSTILSQATVGLENAMRYAEEQRKRSEADTRYRTSRELASTLDMDRVLENACKLAIRSTGSTGAVAFLLEADKGRLTPVLSVSGKGARRSSFPPDATIVAERFEDMYALSDRPPALHLASPSENSVLPAFLRTEEDLTIAPFFTHGKLAGLLCVTDPEGRRHDESQSSQLAAIAGETALAVMNANLHERIKSDAAQMASLVQLANAIGSTAHLPTIMTLALETVRHLFDCSSGLIYRIDDKDGSLRYMESFGYPEEILSRLASPPYPKAVECWTVKEDRLIGVDDLSQTKLDCRTLEKIGFGSTMCVGMQAEGKTLGVLHVRSERPGAFGEQDQQLAMAIADQIGLAIQRALLFEEINRLAATDPLTGVFNVRRLEAVLQEEVSRARRYERSVSFLMVDVDNLKAYNDTLGHQQGDIALSQIASIVDSTTRDVDKVFRYGGDEFSVVLPETGGEEATVVAEKIRRAICEFHFAGEEKIPGGGLTISVGVASFPEDARGEPELIGKADIALYTAKQSGRNSVVSAREG
ncbi:MAG: diguanylate cyclase [Candidatus Geothermincolia bacterium]